MEEVKKSENILLISKVNDERDLLLNIVRSGGFYFAHIDTKVIENNSVDIIYDFKLGDRAIIKSINFR